MKTTAIDPPFGLFWFRKGVFLYQFCAWSEKVGHSVTDLRVQIEPALHIEGYLTYLLVIFFFMVS